MYTLDFIVCTILKFFLFYIVSECGVSKSRIVLAGSPLAASMVSSEGNFGFHLALGPFKCSVTQMGGGGCQLFPGKSIMEV